MLPLQTPPSLQVPPASPAATAEAVAAAERAFAAEVLQVWRLAMDVALPAPPPGP